jgi:hypothetical protein
MHRGPLSQDEAATKIAANLRGCLVRRNIRKGNVDRYVDTDREETIRKKRLLDLQDKRKAEKERLAAEEARRLALLNAEPPPPFVVKAASQTVRSGQMVQCNVGFREEAVGDFVFYLVGRPRPIEIKLPSHMHQAVDRDAPTTDFPLLPPAVGQEHYCGSWPSLEMEPLEVQLHAYTFQCKLMCDDMRQLAFECMASNSHKSHSSFRRAVVLSNPSNATLEFHLEIDPPFRIDKVLCTADVHPRISQIGNKLAPPEIFDEKPPETLLKIPPKQSASVLVVFEPPRAHTSGKVVDDAKFEGSLHVLFSNKTNQRFSLQARYRHPELVPSKTLLVFGTTHVDETKTLEFIMSNDTVAAASFKIVHVPRGRIVNTTADGKALPVVQDEAAAFTFEPAEGIVLGKAKKSDMPVKQKVVVTFKASKASQYTSQYRLTVVNGRGALISCSAFGSYDEAYLGTDLHGGGGIQRVPAVPFDRFRPYSPVL